jgi:hypothetical protein
MNVGYPVSYQYWQSDGGYQWIAVSRLLIALDVMPRDSSHASAVMPGFMPGIHVLLTWGGKQDVDGLDKPGHDKG